MLIHHVWKTNLTKDNARPNYLYNPLLNKQMLSGCGSLTFVPRCKLGQWSLWRREYLADSYKKQI